MSGSKATGMSRKQVLAAVERTAPGQDYVWDGVDDDDRPATEDELRAGVETYRRRAGEAGALGEGTVVPLDPEVVKAFRATGPGWQSRINDALKEWIATHPLP